VSSISTLLARCVTIGATTSGESSLWVKVTVLGIGKACHERILYVCTRQAIYILLAVVQSLIVYLYAIGQVRDNGRNLRQTLSQPCNDKIFLFFLGESDRKCLKTAKHAMEQDGVSYLGYVDLCTMEYDLSPLQ